MSVVIRLTRPCSARVHGADEERERAGAGAVGDDDADALPVEVDAAELLLDERRDRLGCEDTLGATQPNGPTRGLRR